MLLLAITLLPWPSRAPDGIRAIAGSARTKIFSRRFSLTVGGDPRCGVSTSPAAGTTNPGDWTVSARPSHIVRLLADEDQLAHDCLLSLGRKTGEVDTGFHTGTTGAFIPVAR